MFAKEGCEIITASNWETAAKLFSRLDIDYMILDVRSIDVKNLIRRM